MSLTIISLGLIGVSGLTGNVDILEINLCPPKWRVSSVCCHSDWCTGQLMPIAVKTLETDAWGADQLVVA